MELEAALAGWLKGLVDAVLAFDKDIECILTVPGLCFCTVVCSVSTVIIVLCSSVAQHDAFASTTTTHCRWRNFCFVD